VSLTDDTLEREVHHAVIRHRIREETASESGTPFVEQRLTLVATCRQQGAVCWSTGHRVSKELMAFKPSPAVASLAIQVT
jgi:hypothetical protein